MKLLLFPALLAVALPASAQTLTLDNNVTLEWSDVTLSGTNLQVSVKGPTGATTIQSTPASRVMRVDWPYPDELSDALDLILQQKYDAAEAKAESVRKVHVNWKDKPGSWYVPATLFVAECQVKQRKVEDAEKIFTELRNLGLTGTNQKGLLMVQAMQDLEKGATTPALEKALNAAKGLEDSALLARVQLLIGDIKFKEDKFRDALDAYLQVPVFFGAQAQLMPGAELGAARSLFKIGRLADASKSMAAIMERYKDTPEAAAAAKEKQDVDKALTGGVSAPAEAKPAEAPKPEGE